MILNTNHEYYHAPHPTRVPPDARPTRRARASVASPCVQANCEQVFSTAGNLSDPNMDPKFLGILVSIMKNKAAFNPPLAAIKQKYFAKFRGRAKGKDMAEDMPPPFTPAASSAASSGPASGGSGV